MPCPIREWREQYARRRLRVDFEPIADSTFHASVRPIFPELRVVRATLSPGFLFRDEDLLRDGDDSIGFVVAQSGQLTARHLRREIRLVPWRRDHDADGRDRRRWLVRELHII